MSVIDLKTLFKTHAGSIFMQPSTSSHQLCFIHLQTLITMGRKHINTLFDVNGFPSL